MQDFVGYKINVVTVTSPHLTAIVWSLLGEMLDGGCEHFSQNVRPAFGAKTVVIDMYTVCHVH